MVLRKCSLLSSLVFPSLADAFAQRTSSKRDGQHGQSLSFVKSIEQVAKDHDIFLLDMWGVMHDGTTPYEGVLDCVQQLKGAGKELVILSNSSKRRDNSERMLLKLGFDPKDFCQIITSGDISHRMLSGDDTLTCQAWPVLSEIRDKKVFVLGSGSQDEEYCESSGWTLASIEEANLIVARGTFTICDGTSTIKKEDDESEYFRVLDECLKRASARRLPMLITNPDKVRPDKGLPPMPGAIGDAYAELLDDIDVDNLIKRIGKPFPEVYELALQGRDPTKACMVGDALETDVTGGSISGVTTVWVTQDGIHGPTIVQQGSSFEEGAAAVVDEFNAREGTYAKDSLLRPSVVLPHFRW
jgi:HAD superfamily hydrolase (TIGR01459 family)